MVGIGCVFEVGMRPAEWIVVGSGAGKLARQLPPRAAVQRQRGLNQTQFVTNILATGEKH